MRDGARDGVASAEAEGADVLPPAAAAAGASTVADATIVHGGRGPGGVASMAAEGVNEAASTADEVTSTVAEDGD